MQNNALPANGCTACSAHDPQRRLWLVSTAAAGGVAALATAAGGPVEVETADLAPGGFKTFEWRGKPIWVMRRTPEMIAALNGHDAELVDPMSAQAQQPSYATNTARAIQADIFVAIGICTHLGCSPSSAPAGSANPSLPADWPGGFFCPCHGSTFDLAPT